MWCSSVVSRECIEQFGWLSILLMALCRPFHLWLDVPVALLVEVLDHLMMFAVGMMTVSTLASLTHVAAFDD